MAVSGQLTKAQFGFSMPVDAPLYPPPPYFYKNATMMIFKYVTDRDAAARLVPPQVFLADNPTAGLVFASYPWSSLGPYFEVVQYLECQYKGQPFQYAVRLFVTSDAAMAAGREEAGFPKKIAQIDFRFDTAYVASIDRPNGLRLASGTMRPEVRLPAAFPLTLPYLTLRLIPSPQKGAPPSLAELIQTDWVLQAGEIWSGTGSFVYTGASALDPMHSLPLVKPIANELVIGDLLVSANDQIHEDAV